VPFAGENRPVFPIANRAPAVPKRSPFSPHLPASEKYSAVFGQIYTFRGLGKASSLFYRGHRYAQLTDGQHMNKTQKISFTRTKFLAKTSGAIVLRIASVIMLSSHTSAQERTQADVSISKLTLTDQAKPLKTANLKCTITVHNENDDDANEATLIVLVPVEVSIVSHPSNATVYTNGPWACYLVFNLGHMTVGQDITVEFTLTKSKYGNKVGGYAYSRTPDPDPANNYKDATFP
jgi:hypothetical protein